MEIQPYVTLALNELGVSELMGDANNPRILEYFGCTNYPKEQVSDSATPWCAAFICWCLERAGIDSPRSAWSLSFLKWGQTLLGPEFGAICVLSRTTDPTKGHVGIVIGWDQKIVYLLSGNTSNKVTITGYDISKVLGYRRPKVQAPS